MAAADDTHNMALFCDFENVALGVRDGAARAPRDAPPAPAFG